MNPEAKQAHPTPCSVNGEAVDRGPDDYYALCPSCENPGELHGDCEVYDGDEEPAADLESPPGVESNRRYRERWDCDACGASWDEVFIYLGRESR